MTGVLVRRGNLDTHTHTRRGRTAYEDKGGDWGDTSKPRTSKVTSQPPGARGGAWN